MKADFFIFSPFCLRVERRKDNLFAGKSRYHLLLTGWVIATEPQYLKIIVGNLNSVSWQMPFRKKFNHFYN